MISWSLRWGGASDHAPGRKSPSRFYICGCISQLQKRKKNQTPKIGEKWEIFLKWRRKIGNKNRIFLLFASFSPLRGLSILAKAVAMLHRRAQKKAKRWRRWIFIPSSLHGRRPPSRQNALFEVPKLQGDAHPVPSLFGGCVWWFLWCSSRKESPSPSGCSYARARRTFSRVAPANQTKERSVQELFTGAFRNKSSAWIVLVFLRKNTRIHKKGRNCMNFSFWPFLWFGLLGRLLTFITQFYADPASRRALSGPLRLRVQSRSRTRLRIAASIAFSFRACFKGVSDTIAPLSRGWAPQAV